MSYWAAVGHVISGPENGRRDCEAHRYFAQTGFIRLVPLFIRLTLCVFDRPLRHDNVPGELTSPVMPPDMCSIDPAATIFNFVRRPD